jgi:hypothetical protein
MTSSLRVEGVLDAGHHVLRHHHRKQVHLAIHAQPEEKRDIRVNMKQPMKKVEIKKAARHDKVEYKPLAIVTQMSSECVHVVG